MNLFRRFRDLALGDSVYPTFRLGLPALRFMRGFPLESLRDMARSSNFYHIQIF